jgi:hypothetical protein
MNATKNLTNKLAQDGILPEIALRTLWKLQLYSDSIVHTLAKYRTVFLINVHAHLIFLLIVISKKFE